MAAGIRLSPALGITDVVFVGMVYNYSAGAVPSWPAMAGMPAVSFAGIDRNAESLILLCLSEWRRQPHGEKAT